MRPSLPTARHLVFNTFAARIHGQLTIMIRGESEPYHLVGPPDCTTSARRTCGRAAGAHPDNGVGLIPITRREGHGALATFPHRSVAGRHATPAARRSRRVRRRDALSARHRGPAGIDVARAHPQRPAGRPSPPSRSRTPATPDPAADLERTDCSGSPTATAARPTNGGSSRWSRACSGSVPSGSRSTELMRATSS